MHVVIAKQGDDCIIGGAGADTIYGFNGDDPIFGQAGDDKLRGMHMLMRKSISLVIKNTNLVKRIKKTRIENRS